MSYFNNLGGLMILEKFIYDEVPSLPEPTILIRGSKEELNELVLSVIFKLHDHSFTPVNNINNYKIEITED